MTLSEHPISLVIRSVLVSQLAYSMLLVLEVLSFVMFPRGPCKSALAVHAVVFPIALVHPSVFPSHHSLSLSFTLLKLPHKGITIAIEKFAVAVLLIKLIASLESGAILP